MSSTISNLEGVPHTFSSWDTCMSKAYCKWPAIVGIVIGSLIALSILWCIASCLCCGATLCGACVKCLTCGHCCGACRDRSSGGGGGGGSNPRYKEDYSRMPTTPHQGYQPQAAPMMYYNHPNHAGPHFATATFDNPSKRKINEDSLPAMPSWSDARDVHVEDHTEPLHPHGQDVEMGQMQPQHRGPYSQVPDHEAHSPSYDEHYHQQPYNSDLGAQRMDPNPYQFRDAPTGPLPARYVSPLSPEEQRQAYESDRFAAGTVSPAPNEYRGHHNLSPPHPSVSPVSPNLNGYRGQQHHNTGFSSYASTIDSTRYEPTPEYQSYRGAASPPPSFHTEAPLSPNRTQGYRPPSLLQAGRKPVSGYTREV